MTRGGVILKVVGSVLIGEDAFYARDAISNGASSYNTKLEGARILGGGVGLCPWQGH
jgi:hypothetical protein